MNVSVVHGNIPPAAVAQMNARGKKLPEGKTITLVQNLGVRVVGFFRIIMAKGL